ncbi:hypothetical protein [Streptomyces zhihengii]
MRVMRGVGSVAACVAAVVALSGCGAEGEPDSKTSESAAAAPPVSGAFTPEPSPTFPDTPEGDLDRMADEKGWFVNDSSNPYDQAPSQYVKQICKGMGTAKRDGEDPGRWLAEDENPKPSPREILLAGMPKLCPAWSKTAVAALNGDYERVFVYSSGTYDVASEPSESAITPGRWRATGDLEGCYWERTTRSGEIIDNHFATSAREITVTIRASDGQFTSERCGTWEKAG